MSPARSACTSAKSGQFSLSDLCMAKDSSGHRKLRLHRCAGGSDLEIIKRFSCSTQLSMKFVLLMNLKLITIANSFLPNVAEHGNFSANKHENANYCWHFHIY